MNNTSVGAALKQAPDRRRSRPRSLLLVSAKVSCVASAASDHVAFLRDVSPDGVFLYSDFVPQIGCEVEITFDAPRLEKRVRVVRRGKVIRVEQGAKGAAPGIAVRFESERPAA